MLQLIILMSWTLVLKNVLINSILLKADVKAGNSCLCSPKAALLQVYYPLRTMVLLPFRANAIIPFAKALANTSILIQACLYGKNMKEITSRNSLRS